MAEDIKATNIGNLTVKLSLDPTDLDADIQAAIDRSRDAIRAAIRDEIVAQITDLTVSDFRAIIRQEIDARFPALTGETPDSRAREAVRRAEAGADLESKLKTIFIPDPGQ